jgi:flagellum-specific peptidoglycan hydrolase FlgJ
MSLKPLLFTITIGFFVVFFGLNAFVKTEVIVEEKIKHVQVCNEPFSEEALIKAIKEMKLDHPHIVLAQAKLETGHFQSRIFLENNNLFGMKKAWKRPTTAIGTHRGHAVYASWRESLIDYALYSAFYVQEKNEDELYDHLDRNYAQDPIYTTKLKGVVENEQLQALF